MESYRLMNILRLSVFNIIFFILSLGASEDIDFHLKHSASFSFKDSVPLIRVHIKDYKSGLKVSGLSSFKCNKKSIKAESIQVVTSVFVPAVTKYKLSFQEISHSQLKSYNILVNEWKKRTGKNVTIYVSGAIFSINKSRIDNREYFITMEELLEKDEALKLLTNFRARYPSNNISLIPILTSTSSSKTTVKTAKGSFKCTNTIELSPKDNLIIGEDNYENSEGFFLVPTSGQKISLAKEASIEKLVEKILPGEMFLSAPLETLKAQAVAARTDIFMQLGKRHVSEPWHICSEVHCQKVIWGQKIQDKFVKAVNETKGEIILYDGSYVARAPYCSSAGGHTEDIRNVWFTAEKKYLKGIWDGDKPLDLNLRRESDLETFLNTDYGEDNIEMNKRHRWKKEITTEEMDKYLSKFKLGHIKKLQALKRGVSGRIYKMNFEGTKGRKTIYGELNIRRLLGNMNSSSFIVRKRGNKWMFKGMGWGHGVGMSQIGAISLGRKDKTYKYILKRYYPGTEVKSLY